MSPGWLLHDGRVFAEALVLSHDEQLTRLATVVPQAVDAAVVAGDPCFDRLRASRPLRDHYRKRLSPDRPATVVTVSSTWGPHSLLGSWPSLVRELLSELPVDSHRVLLIAHPNVWYAHGPWQLRSWLADATRAGLTVIDPLAGWQQAILASDVVIGDHGAVTGYAAALGIPTLLGTRYTADTVAGTAIDVLARTAPRLHPGQPLAPQLPATAAGSPPSPAADIADLITAVPDRAAHQLRGLFYRLLSLPEPPTEPAVHPYPGTDLPTAPPEVTAAVVHGAPTGTGVHLERFPADVLRHRSPLLPSVDGHLVVHVNHPVQTLRSQAAILYCHRDEAGPDELSWLSETYGRWPSCALTAVLGPTSGTVYAGPARIARITHTTRSPLLVASAIHLWLSGNKQWTDLPPRLRVTTGPATPPIHAALTLG